MNSHWKNSIDDNSIPFVGERERVADKLDELEHSNELVVSSIRRASLLLGCFLLEVRSKLFQAGYHHRSSLTLLEPSGKDYALRRLGGEKDSKTSREFRGNEKIRSSHRNRVPTYIAQVNKLVTRGLCSVERFKEFLAGRNYIQEVNFDLLYHLRGGTLKLAATVFMQLPYPEKLSPEYLDLAASVNIGIEMYIIETRRTTIALNTLHGHRRHRGGQPTPTTSNNVQRIDTEESVYAIQAMTHHYDIYGGLPLPNCPFPDSTLPPTSDHSSLSSNLSAIRRNPESSIMLSVANDGGLLHSPTVSMTYILSAVAFLIFTIIIAATCEGAKVFNRRVRSKSVQNGWWALWFFILASSYAIDGIRYSAGLPMLAQDVLAGLHTPILYPHSETVDPLAMDSWLLSVSAMLRRFSTLVLSLALHHQLKHRSSWCLKETDDAFPSYSNNNPTVNNTSNRIHSSLSRGFHRNSRLLESSSSQAYQAMPTSSEPARLQQAVQQGSNGWKERHVPNTGLIPIYDEVVETVQDEEVPAHFHEKKCNMSGALIAFVTSWEFLFALLWALNVLLLIAANPPGSTASSSSSTILTYLFACLSILQHLPILALVYIILISPFEESIGNRRSHGPSRRARFVLGVACLTSLPLWVEPSILSRAVISSVEWHAGVVGRNVQSRICTVPPWWWRQGHQVVVDDDILSLVESDGIDTRGFHFQRPKSSKKQELIGWASSADVLNWVGLSSVWMYYWFMRIEHRRNYEEWLWLIVSHTSSVFGF
ncbi:hypothetical protein SeMB42_g02831 [Synchytrium endobioticum]|uniref:Uncharacterized protein n=1 Tax=Synchytrium endobioticum TaxID=286115 RepID=A0A507DAV5_9FUNG|nr:hypothetical protein SeMB42_g02831 [Synchytrium endobioticum]